MRIMNKKKNIIGLFASLAIIIVLILTLVILYINFANDNDNVSGIVEQDIEQIDWRVYTNDKYGFELKFPVNWQMFEDFTTDSPIINIYPKTFNSNPPYTHFDNITNVSIFPKGIPTTGIIGEQSVGMNDETITNYLNEDASSIINFNLSNQSVWSRSISFNEAPATWEPYGFMWVRYDTSDYEEKCYREDKEIGIYECDIFQGDNIVRSGTRSNNNIDLINQIVASFRFIK